jgi:stress response protein YsnF
VETSVSRKDEEKVIPLFGERIIITKKMTKLNDLVIRKRRVVENKKISERYKRNCQDKTS